MTITYRLIAAPLALLLWVVLRVGWGSGNQREEVRELLEEYRNKTHGTSIL